MLRNSILLLIGFLTCALLPAQSVLKLSGGKLVIQKNTQVVLQDASWGNDGGQLVTDSGAVVFRGVNTDSIGGSNPTSFGLLVIDKNSGDIELKQATAVADSMILANGLVLLGEHDLSLLNQAGISPGLAGSYLRTDGTGALHMLIGAQPRVFPVGGSSFRPATLSPQASPGQYSIRVTDQVLSQGSSGSPLSQEAVASTWWLTAPSGSNTFELMLQWNGSDEFNGFDRNLAYLSRYDNGWDASPPIQAAGGDPYTISRLNITQAGQFTVFGKDNLPPQISCPAAIQAGNDAGQCGALVTYTPPVGTDNAAGPLTNLSGGLGSGAFFPVGVSIETYTVTDVAGFSASCSFTITVNDTEAPVANCPSNITQNNDAQTCGAVISFGVTTSDNCPGETLSQTAGLASGNLFSIGTTTNTFTVTDAAGNTANCSFTINITDNNNPTISCPANISANNDQDQCGAVISYALPTYQDNCNSSIQLTSGLGNGSLFPIGTTTETYVVTDASGNTASCSFDVEISDSQLPVLNCSQNIVRNNDADLCGAIVSYSVTTSDNCPGENLSQTSGQVSGTIFAVGITINEFLVTDASGNTASCSFTITVNDTQAPDVTCPANISVTSGAGICGAVVSYAISTSDNCIGEFLSQTAGQTSNTTFPQGISTNSFTVTDAAGNTASCSFTVEVLDDTDPEIICPGNISQSNDLGVCGAIVTYAVSSSDNCMGENVSQTTGQASGSTFPVGSTTNSFTVTDAGGNTAACSFDVIITDDEDPTISCPANIQLANTPGQCDRTVTFLAPNGQDNCNSTTARTTGLGSGATFPLGTNPETYVVTDASGNTASCAFTITIIDDEAPLITMSGDNPLLLCEGEPYVEAGATAIDNCDQSVAQNIIINASHVNSAQEGVYQVTYTVTDVNGNSSQATRQVIVRRTPVQLAPQNCGNCSQIRLDFCEGEAAPDLEALLTANANYEPGVTLLWYADNSNSQGSPIAAPTPNMSNNNTRFYWVSQAINACEGPARRVRVRVRKTSTVVMDLPAIGCGTATLDLAAWTSDSRGIASGFTFYDADPNSGATSIGSVTATQGQVNSGQYAVVSLPSGPVTYYAVASNNTGCQVTGSDEVSSSAGASLDPVANLTVNSGDLVHVSFTSPDASHILWLNHSGFNNPYIGLLGSIGLGDLVFTANNLTATAQTATLRAIAYNGNCAGQVRDFTITVNPGTNNRQAGNSLQLTADKINAHDVQLNWQIRYEFALTHIEIEKQKNDGEWTLIGTSDNLSSSHIDRGGMGNVTKYRLKLIHADGRAIWSQEVEVNFDYYNTERFTLYPNPSDGRFNLRAAGPLEGEWRYKLSDQLGRTILLGKLTGSETAFDISHLPTAHYFLLLTSPEGKSYLQKIVKY